MPQFEGGAPLPVVTGGEGPVDGRKAAVPVYVVSGGQAPLGQRARRVIVVTDGLVQGGAAIPVYDAGPTALYSGEAALPVYIVSGPNLYPLAYTSKIDALGPIAYWPLAESSGSVANDESGNGRNGAYSNVTLGQPGIGDGRTAASFGLTSTTNIYSASFASAFNGQQGSAGLWFRITDPTVWTDGTVRKCLQLFSDASNRLILQKTATNNQLNVTYIAGGTNKSISFTTAGPLTWQHLLVTWDKAGDALKLYINGVQQGATATGLGTYAGALSVTNQRIGGGDAGPTNPWLGLIAHVPVWDVALSAAQVAAVAQPT